MLGCGPQPRLYGQARRAAVNSRTEIIRSKNPMLTLGIPDDGNATSRGRPKVSLGTYG
jgi:hypothetical protein